MGRAEKHIMNNEIKDRKGITAIIPAMLLCAVPFIILLLDLFVPSMSALQYKLYPAMIRTVSLISIICMAACFSMNIDRGRLHIDFKDVCFMLFTVCMLISTGINGFSHKAFFSVPYRYVGVFDLFIFIFIYMYCSGCIDSERLKTAFFVCLMAVSDLVAAAFFCDHFIVKIPAFNDKLEPSAIFFHGNHYGYFLVTVIAVSAGCYCFSRGKAAFMGGLSFITGLAALALNRSMGCILAAAATLAIIFLVSVIQGDTQRNKALVMAVCIAVVSACMLVISSQLRADIVQTFMEFRQITSGDNNIYAGNGRWGIWQYVASYIADYPWWGYGCEGIAEIMKDYTLTTNPHNEPLTYAAFFGIPAAVFYCAGVIAAVIKGLRANESRACMIASFGAMAYFLSSLFGVAMFYTAPYLFILMGIAAGDKN